MLWPGLRVKVFFVVATGGGERAEVIEYKFAATGDAAVGFACFSDVAFTATLTGDTAGVLNTSGSSVVNFLRHEEITAKGRLGQFGVTMRNSRQAWDERRAR